MFFLLGAAKLYHSSMLGQSASLYMTLPVSYWKMVWGKLLTGGFQLFLLQLLGLCGLILASASAASNGIQQPVMINLELNVKSVIMGGVPAEHIGFFCLELFLAMFLADMLFCAGILLAAVTVHAMRLSSAKVPLGILIYGFVLALLAAGIWLAFLCMKNAAAPHALLSLTGVTLMNAAALLFFAFLNKTLLSKRLEVN